VNDANWDRTRELFRRVAAREGIRRVAEQIPAHHATVYRLLEGETECPTRAVRAGIERIVQQHQNQQGKP